MNQPPEHGEPDLPGMPPEANSDAQGAAGTGPGTGASPDAALGVARIGNPAPGSGPGEPGWAKGLRKLYNSVVDEPLPDSFRDLLKKLDGSDDD